MYLLEGADLVVSFLDLHELPLHHRPEILGER
jgi:hypothetical protein